MPFIWNTAVLHANDGVGVVPHDTKNLAFDAPLPPLEPAESDSDTDVGSDSDSESEDIDGVALHPDIPPLTQTRKSKSTPRTRLSQANLPLPSTLARVSFRLPQPPGMAHTHIPPRSSACRLNGTIRAQPQPQRSITNSSLEYSSPRRGLSDPRTGLLPQPPAPTRSDDRARAAERMFRAIGKGHSTPPRLLQRTESRISLLNSLSVRARRRHEKDAIPPPKKEQDTDDSSVMCELSFGTITVNVTPPTPPMTHTSQMGDDTGPTGVRITSHKLAHLLPEPTSPMLMPPPFELAPGRMRVLEERSRMLRLQAAASQQAPKPRSQQQQQKSDARVSFGMSDKYVPPARRQARIPGACRPSPGSVRRQLQ